MHWIFYYVKIERIIFNISCYSIFCSHLIETRMIVIVIVCFFIFCLNLDECNLPSNHLRLSRLFNSLDAPQMNDGTYLE